MYVQPLTIDGALFWLLKTESESLDQLRLIPQEMNADFGCN